MISGSFKKCYHKLFIYKSYLIYIYIYIYIVIHRQICFVLSELISVARQARFLNLGSKPCWLKHQSKILPLSHEETSTSKVNLNGYESQLLLLTYIRLTATESLIHIVTVHKYLSQDGSLFYARVTSGQSGTSSLAK